MKLVFYVLISCFWVAVGYTQEQVVPIENQADYAEAHDSTPYYYKDINHVLDKFIGTWEVTSGTEYLKINITKLTKRSLDEPLYESNDYQDILKVTLVSYKKNNIEVYNNCAIAIVYSPIYLLDVNTAKFYYHEPTTGCKRNKGGNLTLTYLPNQGSNGELQWHRDTFIHEGAQCFNGGTVDRSEFLIPRDLTLQKL
ncbi:hypothetical protein NBRC110019_32520 [Neptunitalea chrysea]|uniref:DUF6705 domain-containing protein n=1 Tax=Neptunitalea chrysea TaxID=1647581 RepID=A0A9W6B950_9FLAO|nr:DUF6705 family protein [Neptunitalea chrysea]GLB54210.1 hypothetical protein NBRC110019_32520 [Neptunitalea chrysea]